MMVTVRTLFAAFLLCASADAAWADDDFEPVEKEEEFLKKIVNKRLVYENGAVVVFQSDGRMGGGFKGSVIDGIWKWDGEKGVCHHLSVGQKKYEPSCRIPQIDGKKIRFVQEDGHIYGVARIR